ncbi:MAG: DNA polymerase III subunit delta' [Rhodobacteraceae bacterium]|nr:DNA polymerase III subunit delta' [Paracoccaceae bacterium]
MSIYPEEVPPEPDRTEGALHPRFTEQVFGHAAAEADFMAAATSGRLHHAWLLTGPRGVGKATLAWRMARFLLATPPDTNDDALLAAPTSNIPDIPTGHPVARRLRALSEPGLMLLRRPWDEKRKRLRAEITVDEVRRLKDFFALSVTDGGRRVVLIDAADEMNKNAANAVLKVLEEPPANAVLLLVAHQPSCLLPTIRSRCRGLHLSRLGPADLHIALAQAGVEAADGGLAELAEGSVGAAVRLAALDGVALYGDLLALLATLPRLDRSRVITLAEKATAREAEAEFDLTLTLFDRLMARLALVGTTGRLPPEILPGEGEILARLAPDPPTGRAWADLAQGLTARVRRGRAVNLDPAALILDMCLSLDQMVARLPA